MKFSHGFAAVLAGLGLLLFDGPASAVVGGREGGPAETATLMVLNARGGVCSAIVLSSRAILTAAHCAAGGVDLRVHWKDGGSTPVLIAPAGIALHPEFDAKAITARRRSIDLALLRLEQSLPGRFTPAVLFDGPLPRAGATVTLAGYGVLEEGEARTTGTYRSAALVTVEPYGPGRILLWASEPGTGGKRPGSGACQGDSGGPMLGDDGGVVAVTSWSTGPSGKQCGLLSQGVLVAPQRNWMDKTLLQWGESAVWTTRR